MYQRSCIVFGGSKKELLCIIRNVAVVVLFILARCSVYYNFVIIRKSITKIYFQRATGQNIARASSAQFPEITRARRLSLASSKAISAARRAAIQKRQQPLVGRRNCPDKNVRSPPPRLFFHRCCISEGKRRARARPCVLYI